MKGVNCTDERLRPDFDYWCENNAKELTQAISRIRVLDNQIKDILYPIWKAGYMEGFKRCADANSDPYPD